MNKFRFLTYVLLFAGLAVSSCQKSPTNSFSEEDSSKLDAVTSVTIAPGSFAKASLNSEPSLIIEGGSYHTCAFYPEDGNVVCWGQTYNWDHLGPDHNGSNTDDYMEGDAVKADIGSYTNCILKEDGTTKCWGYRSAAVEYSEGDAIDVGVGYGNACVLTEDGNVKCTGIYFNEDNWILLHDQGNAVDVLMSASAACAQTADSNTLQCQGWNVKETSWEVNGTPTGDANGHYAMCVLTEEGNMDCMNSGYNNGPYGAYGPQGGYTLGYHRTDEAMPQAIDMDAGFGIGCYALENGDINCFIAETEDQIDISHPGVGAIAVSVTDQQDICYSDASGNITCTQSTPDEYKSGPSDTEAPEITFSDVTTNLWPPNHKMQMVGQVTATDESSITVFDVTISSNESSNGRGDGNTENDYEVKANGMGGYDIYVRAERTGKDAGRTYTITATAEDEFGNAASDSIEVSVSKSQAGGRK